MPVLEVSGLTKRYPSGLLALDRLSVAIGGRAVGLLGPNGAGKSTLVKILLGLIPPTAGRAAVLGLDCAREALRVRELVGYMPENESFIPGLDGVRYVYLAGRLVGMPHADAMQRAHVVLDYVGLDEQRYRPVETYSTGMKQKVKFAQALVHHPRLLLLDEPTAGLDPRGREEMLDLVRDLARRKGMHVVLSTHILPDVEATCDEVVILDRGALVRQGKLEELRAGDGECFEVRVKGAAARFVDALGARGWDARAVEVAEEGDEGELRVSRRAAGAPEIATSASMSTSTSTSTSPGAGAGASAGAGTEPILRAAVEAGVQLRHLGRSRSTLDELFTRLLEDARAGNGPR